MSATMLWTGRVLTGLFTLFMLGGSIAPKLAGARVATEAMTELGWDPRYTTMIGFIELASLILHLVPRTAFLGSVLMTALLGGAIATQLRAEQPMFSHVLFGVYLGLAMWGGLWLRSPQLRESLPIMAG
jgi:DoxX-like protein